LNTGTSKGWLDEGYIKHSINGNSCRKHRTILEKHLGRKLTHTEDVHHINGIKTDNYIDNLQILTHSEHMILHHNIRRGLL